ncbi:hypothetical protein C8J56DRAFT_1168685 [Mycena floridula]|nr:hypothetical protein C8J56DRAFT_1168685 [Mycena floridula]
MSYTKSFFSTLIYIYTVVYSLISSVFYLNASDKTVVPWPARSRKQAYNVPEIVITPPSEIVFVDIRNETSTAPSVQEDVVIDPRQIKDAEQCLSPPKKHNQRRSILGDAEQGLSPPKKRRAILVEKENDVESPISPPRTHHYCDPVFWPITFSPSPPSRKSHRFSSGPIWHQDPALNFDDVFLVRSALGGCLEDDEDGEEARANVSRQTWKSEFGNSSFEEEAEEPYRYSYRDSYNHWSSIVSLDSYTN